jgi:glutamate synthase domain-containing protein 2
MTVHELGLEVAREALALAGVHEVPPLAADGQLGRDVVVAALVRQRNTE